MANLIKIVFDPNYDYGFAVGGDIDNVYLPNAPYDSNYKAQGYEKYFVCNGSLFYSYQGKYDAEGIEVIEGVSNQHTSMTAVQKHNNDMALIVRKDENKLVFARQEDINWEVDAGIVYCGITGIGIMLDGKQFPITTAFPQYNQKSGRTLIGTDKDGNFLSFSIKGETGKAGYYGKELFKIAQDNGFYNCLCLDGGGSVYRQFNGKVDISTTRKIKNTFIIYRKKRTQPEPTDEYKELYEKEKAKNELLSSKISKIKEIINQ